MKSRKWVTRNLETPYGPVVKCNFHTRVIIPGDRTPSGERYEFTPGEERDDVMAKDTDYLLGLVYQQTGCCGNKPGEPINYFVLA